MIVHIAPNTIQQITPSLRAFSSLSPVSATVATLDESIKSGLETVRDLYFWLLVISTVVVFVGVVLEEGEGWMSYLKSVLPLQPITEYRLIKKLAKLGWILICAGVMGEGVFEVLVARADNAIHSFDEALLNEARKEAGDAATSAKTAHDEADVVGKEADAIQKRLDGASRQLSEVEQQVRIQGPRQRLLEDNRDKFLESLKPFAGQRVTVVKCGYALQAEPEQLEQYLLNLLGVSKASKPNAGWVVESPGYTTWAKCNTGASAVGGNLVIVSSTADRTVKAAATALNDALNRIDISTTQTESTPEGRQLELQFLGDDSPWELAIKDPTAVIILIGTNPMFDLSGWHKRHK